MFKLQNDNQETEYMFQLRGQTKEAREAVSIDRSVLESVQRYLKTLNKFPAAMVRRETSSERA